MKQHDTRTSTGLDRVLARVCATCPVCRRARHKQAGAAYRFVQKVEGGLCPFCRAYERVYGEKSYEPIMIDSTPRE